MHHYQYKAVEGGSVLRYKALESESYVHYNVVESESALHCGAVKSEWVSWFKVAETRESVLGLFKTLKRLCYQEFPRIKTPKPHGLTHFLQCGSLDNTFESTVIK